jgi:lipopolysaccharide export system permease protein
MLALSLFIAVVVSLGRMYRESEMAIWFSSGIGLSRFMRPVLRGCWPVLVLVALLVVFVWPWGNQQLVEMRVRYEQRSDISRVAPGSFQSSADGSRVFFIEREGESAGIGRNVFLLSSKGQQESVTTARAGTLQGSGAERELVLQSGHRNDLDRASGQHTRMSFERFRLAVDSLQAQDAQSPAAKAMGTLDLLRSPGLREQGELVWRLGLLFGAGNLLLLGIGLSASNPRRASNWNLMFALLAFVVYYNLINLGQAWVGAGKLGLGSGLLGLHGGMLLVALGLIWWRDNAAAVHWRRWFVRGAA